MIRGTVDPKVKKGGPCLKGKPGYGGGKEQYPSRGGDFGGLLAVGLGLGTLSKRTEDIEKEEGRERGSFEKTGEKKNDRDKEGRAGLRRE